VAQNPVEHRIGGEKAGILRLFPVFGLLHRTKLGLQRLARCALQA
jgi:hypothetical protein